MLEREHKWLVPQAVPDAERLAEVFAAKGVVVQPSGARDQRDTYFDTPERELFGAGAALRIRRFGGETLATFKGPGAVVGSLHLREETEVPFVTPWPETIRAKLASLSIKEARLEPLLELHTVRTRYLLRRGEDGWLAELSFDEVSAASGERTIHFKELELEAHSATPDDTLSELAESVAGFGLTPHTGDKLTHARTLLGL